jgi:ribosomal protein S18 acetylase RimI-like enzyme
MSESAAQIPRSSSAAAPVFRLATAADIPTLLSFMRALNEADPGPTPFDEPAAREALERFLANDSFGRAWLILDGSSPVGYVVLTLGYSLEYRGRDAFIDEFFIAASHRSRGWGRAAIAFVEVAARSVGVRAIHLEVSHSNPRAYDFYRRAGFEDYRRFLLNKWL